MSNGKPESQPYMVSVYEPKGAPEALAFTLMPKRSPQGRDGGEPPRPNPQYVVLVRGNGANIAFDWSRTPDDPGPARPQLEDEVQKRFNARAAWIDRVSQLVGQVEQWGRELGWATRRIDKRLEDSAIGKHQVAALLMQEGTCRVLLEPVGRSAPGAEGVVDLYLMPAYDDIASLYYYGNRWNLHYLFPDGTPPATVREAAGVPLSKEALQRVLEEMKQQAA